MGSLGGLRGGLRGSSFKVIGFNDWFACFFRGDAPHPSGKHAFLVPLCLLGTKGVSKISCKSNLGLIELLKGDVRHQKRAIVVSLGWVRGLLGSLWGVWSSFGCPLGLCGDLGGAFWSVLGGSGWVVGSTGLALGILLGVLGLLRRALGSILRSLGGSMGSLGRLWGG